MAGDGPEVPHPLTRRVGWRRLADRIFSQNKGA
jgi:hypothetical protein